MDHFVERSYTRAVSSTAPPARDTVTGEAKMAAPQCPAETLQSPTLPGVKAIDPTSPAGIAQAVVTLMCPTLTANVDAAVHRGLKQPHLEVQAEVQRI